MATYEMLKDKMSEISIELADKVSQQECEDRRRELRASLENVQKDISKLVGINKVHTEQIGNIKNLIQWLAGITSGILVSLIFLVIKGALNIGM